MDNDVRSFDRALLEKALDSLTHSAGTRSGQMCHLEPDAWSELRDFLRASLQGRDVATLADDKREPET